MYFRCPSAKTVSKARVDLPDPDKPVTTTSWSRGMSIERFLRLCSRAPRIRMYFWLSLMRRVRTKVKWLPRQKAKRFIVRQMYGKASVQSLESYAGPAAVGFLPVVGFVDTPAGRGSVRVLRVTILPPAATEEAADAIASSCFYARRIARRHRHHRGARGAAAPRAEQGAGI